MTLRNDIECGGAKLEPPPALGVWQWAELRRTMGRDVTARPGKYSVAFAPYQRAPQEAFTDIEVQLVILYWGKRLGKTEILNNLHGSTMEENPRNMLHVLPTRESGMKHTKQFFMPMVRSTPVLTLLIRDSRMKDANNTIMAKQFPGGTFSVIGANSPSGFRQVQAPVVTCDEIDAMETGKEGDPVLLALGRAENYNDCIQVLSSTATYLETSRIHSWYLKSDQQKWLARCPICGKLHILLWACVKWPKDKPELAIYECPDCANTWNDKTRLQAIRAGEWRPTAPFKGIRGFWLNGLNSVFPAKKGFKTKLHQFAGEFLDAYTSGDSARMVWKNTFLCEPEEIKGEKIEREPLLERREDYGPNALPNQIVVIVCAVDVQGDRLEYEIMGLGEADETWGIEYGKLMGDPERDEVWDSLGETLRKKFKRLDGTELSVTATAMDHGHKGHRVKHFIKTCGLPRVWAVYGGPRRSDHVLAMTNHKKQLTAIDTFEAKEIIFARLKMIDHGPGFMHYPLGADGKMHPEMGYEAHNKYFEGLTCEEKQPRFNKGRVYYDYVKPSSARNEPIDLRAYLLTCIYLLNPRIQAIQANLEVQKTPGKEYQLKPAPAPVMEHPELAKLRFPMPRRSGGFVQGWRK